MAISKQISHEGIINSIDNNHIVVEILQSTACQGCQIASHCNASLPRPGHESKRKCIDVYADGSSFNVGQQVTVFATWQVARRALILAFVVPLAILMVSTVALLGLGASEPVAALTAIALLTPYYIILWILRHRIAMSVSFGIST